METLLKLHESMRAIVIQLIANKYSEQLVEQAWKDFNHLTLVIVCESFHEGRIKYNPTLDPAPAPAPAWGNQYPTLTPSEMRADKYWQTAWQSAVFNTCFHSDLRQVREIFAALAGSSVPSQHQSSTWMCVGELQNGMLFKMTASMLGYHNHGVDDLSPYNWKGSFHTYDNHGAMWAAITPEEQKRLDESVESNDDDEIVPF